MIRKGIIPYFTTLLLAAALSAVQTWADPSKMLPPLRSEDDKIALLVQIKHEIPELFSDAAKFDIDLLGILDDEKKLVAELEKIPRFNELMKAKLQNLLEIRVQAKADLKLTEVKISPESVQEWKASLLRALAEAKELPNWSALIHKTPTPPPSALLGGVIASLPPEQKKTVSAAIKGKSSNEIVAALQAVLPLEMPDSFRFAQAGFSKRPSRAEVILEFQSRLQAIQREEALLALFLVLHPAVAYPTPGYKTPAEARTRIESLDTKDLEHLRDPDAAANIIRHAFPTQPATNVKALGERTAQGIQRFVKTTESTSEFKARSLTLREAPPIYGIFRGCTGGDCSSQYSFPYPNDPHERVFFVTEETGKLLGYVSSTEVTSNGKKGLYVITIAGSHISTADTEMIFHALDANKAALGVESILLPPASHLKGLINFTPIRGSYQKYATGKSVPIEYQDLPIRKAIERFESKNNEGHYDYHTQNIRGEVFSPDSALADKISTSTQVTEAAPLTLPQPTQSDLIELALDMNHSGRKEISTRIFKSAGLSPQKASELIAALSNQQAESVGVWRTRLQKMLSEFHAEELIKKEYLLFPGRLSAPDAFAPENAKESLSLVTKKFSEFPDLNEKTQELLKRNIKTIINHPPIRERINKTIVETPGRLEASKLYNTTLKYDLGVYDPGGEFSEAWMQHEAGKLLMLDHYSDWNYKHAKDYLRRLIEIGSPEMHKRIAAEIFSQPLTAEMKDLYLLLIEKGDKNTRLVFVSKVLSKSHTEKMNDLRRLLIKSGDPEILQALAISFPEPYPSEPHPVWKKKIIKLLIEKGDANTLQNLAGGILSYPRVELMDEFQLLIKNGDHVTRERLATSLANIRSTERLEMLHLLLEKGDPVTFRFFAENVFTRTQTSWMSGLMRRLIERADPETLAYLEKNTFTQSHWATREFHSLKNSLYIAAPLERREFLEKHYGKNAIAAGCLTKVLQGLQP